MRNSPTNNTRRTDGFSGVRPSSGAAGPTSFATIEGSNPASGFSAAAREDGRTPLNRHRQTAGFTLIELILVMALLAVVVSFAAPTLSHFFRSRKLDSEARRFVALTRYGQNMAVSVGSPMVLWLDLVDGTYGVRDQSTYSLKDIALASEFVRQRQGHEAIDTKQPEFRLAENLRFELVENVRTNGRIATVRFLPDGAIDEGSLRSLLILQENRKSRQSPEDAMVWITQSVNGSRYEIVDQTNVWERVHSGTEIPRGFHVR